MKPSDLMHSVFIILLGVLVLIFVANVISAVFDDGEHVSVRELSRKGLGEYDKKTGEFFLYIDRAKQ